MGSSVGGAGGPTAASHSRALPALLAVASWLDARDLGRLAATCRALRGLCSLDVLWKPLAVSRWAELEHRTDNKEWRDCFKRKRGRPPLCAPT